MVSLLRVASRRWLGMMAPGIIVLAAVFSRSPQADEPVDLPAIRPNAVVDEPLSPVEAARTMIVPDGFQVTLFAGESDVRQPIGICTDDRGRLWIAEAYNYPNHGTTPGDRIIILEDTDGDGRADERTVFYDGLNYVTGIEVGFGGAWVMSPPYFYFIPDRDADDRPDGPAEVLLDGFGNHANAHNLANGLAWGPDGWLYGTHGRTNWSKLGKPGTPDEERTVYDGGVYRYHPTRHVWEPYADGTTNPWGIDWNDYGEAFICNCVNPHLFHVIYGAHYEPWRNRESSRYAYQRIPTIADHLHFVGGNNVRNGFGTPEEDAAGGGHAHCGTMIYLGDNWPDRYRSTFFTNNIHGRRINNDLLARHGSRDTSPRTAGMCCGRAIRGSWESRCSTVPTAACSSATGRTPASATASATPAAKPVGSTMFAMASPNIDRSIWRSSATPNWSPCKHTATTGSCDMPAGCCRSGPQREK